MWTLASTFVDSSDGSRQKFWIFLNFYIARDLAYVLQCVSEEKESVGADTTKVLAPLGGRTRLSSDL
jgi:hypothetical protein